MKMMRRHPDRCHPALPSTAASTQPPQPSCPRRRASMSSNTIDDGRLARDRPLADEDQPSPTLLAASGLRTFEREPTRGGATHPPNHEKLAPSRDLLTATRHRQRSTEPEDAAPVDPLIIRRKALSHQTTPAHHSLKSETISTITA